VADQTISPADELLVKREFEKDERVLLSRESASMILKAAAVDSLFYSRCFFPRSCSQDPPGMHREIWDVMERQENRYVANAVFRGGAKTTLTRLFTSKRISYGISRLTLCLSRSQKHALYSIDWLKKNVERNKKWAQFFGLHPGSKWTGEEIEIVSDVSENVTRVIALGITGQIRGYNVDDARPDLIVGDDIDSDETTATPEQREKTRELVHGALVRSLAPQTENPNAKFVLNQTPLHSEDNLAVALRDPSYAARIFSCFDAQGKSRWPSRFPTETLLKEKEAYIARNQLSLWLREMECRIVARETRSFRLEWLRYWQILPPGGVFVAAIDPASSSEKEACFQVLSLIYIVEPDYYLVYYSRTKGEMPEQLWAKIREMVFQFQDIRVIGVEAIAYQRVLQHYLERKMEESGLFIPIAPISGDRRKKADRIIQTIGRRAAYGHLWIRQEHAEFIEEYVDHSPSEDHKYDDLLDATSMAMELLNPTFSTAEVFKSASDYYNPSANMRSEATNNLKASWRGAP
jgi:hypothetical protein